MTGDSPRKSSGLEAVPDTQTMIAELRFSNRLLAVLATKDMEQRDAISFLDSVGFQPKQIAAALGMTRNAVSIAFHRMRKAADSVPEIVDVKQQRLDGIE